MNRLASSLLLVAVLACQHDESPRSSGVAPPPPPAEEGFVLPGAFSEQTTVDDLRVLYGESNVALTELPDGGGPGVVLFPNDPTRRATVRFWESEPPLHHLASVTVTDPESRWVGKLGVRIGTSLAELRRRNAAEFWFVGFDAERTATVRDMWNAGGLDFSAGESLYFGVDLRVREGVPAAAHPSGGDHVSSDDPRYPKLGESAFVSSMSAWSSLDDE